MIKTKTIGMLVLALALAPAVFAATAEEKCQKKKLIALGKRSLCYEKERSREALGKTSDTMKCEEKFDKMIEAAEKKAACRWLEHGDGTATDLNSGLQWELKTDDGSLHDKDDTYTWGDAVSEVSTFRGNDSADGVTSSGCFAEKCGWRLPTIEELWGIIDLTAPGCGSGAPCSTIPGEPVPTVWASTSLSGDASRAFIVSLASGVSVSTLKTSSVNQFGFLAVSGGP